MGNPWPRTLGQIGGVLLFAVLLGFAAGLPLPALAVAALGCLGWLLHRLYRLERWLRADARQPPLAAEGLWGELYHHYYRLRKRSRKRKRRLTRALNQFQKAAAALPDACVVLDREGIIRWCNDPATRLLGLRYPQD
ncbi:MAG: phosphate regulon sensor protein PhoR, partial [Pseudomonadota bacterium]|nr:phosphate regulon sensor protein PhoR [Pseudomonadota bacterium]